MKYFFFIPFLIVLSACSLYRSKGRNQFEYDANNGIHTSSLKSCQKQNAFSAWIQDEFPTQNYEMIHLEPDLEIWKSHLNDGSVEIRAIQTNEDKSRLSCTYQFANETTWQQMQKQFVQELENNLMVE